MLILVIAGIFTIAMIFHEVYLGIKEDKLRDKLAQTIDPDEREVLENIKKRRRQLLEKYGDETIISKLGVKEHYYKIKKLCKDGEQVIHKIEKINEISTRLSMDNSQLDNSPSTLLSKLIKKRDTYVYKDSVKKAIEHIDKLLDSSQDHKEQGILEQYKQEFCELEEIFKSIFQHCRSFVGEDDCDEIGGHIIIGYFTINNLKICFIEEIKIRTKRHDSEINYVLLLTKNFLQTSSLSKGFWIVYPTINIRNAIDYLQDQTTQD